MIQYRISESINKDTLTRFVEGYLKDGWTLAGGVSAAYDPNERRVVYYQALLKEEQHG